MQPIWAPRLFGISSEGQKSFRSGTKQHPVDDAAILEAQWTELVWEGEDDVEVLHVENLFLPGLEPRGTGRALALRAMPVTARVVQADDVTALVALLCVASQGGRLALYEVGQDATLLLDGR